MIPPQMLQLIEPGGTAVELARVFEGHGHVLYLVGGSVRDAMLEREVDDLDFTTDARPDRIKEVVAKWADDLYLAGERFGTVGAIRAGRVHEITTYRSEVYRDDSRKPSVEFSDDIVEDLSRRDFTINAMALRLPGAPGSEPDIVDPHGGLIDLAAGLLRTPLDPHESFGDDPLRMLRLFRFVSTLGFRPDDDAVAAVAEMRQRLGIISAERIKDEFAKLMVGKKVGDALWWMLDTGLAEEFIPELPGLALEQDPHHHHKDVLAHTIAVVDKTSARLVLRLAALFHDVGKPATREFGPAGVTFHHHEVVGARMTRARLKALRFPNKDIEAAGQLVFLHMRPHTYKMGWTDAAVRRYVRDAGPLLNDLNELVRCDVTTRNERRARTIQNRIDELEFRIDELGKLEELQALRPPIDGNQVMEHLGLEPGPQVGEVMRMLYEHRVEHGPYSPEEALEIVDEWWADRG